MKKIDEQKLMIAIIFHCIAKHPELSDNELKAMALEEYLRLKDGDKMEDVYFLLDRYGSKQ